MISESLRYVEDGMKTCARTTQLANNLLYIFSTTNSSVCLHWVVFSRSDIHIHIIYTLKPIQIHKSDKAKFYEFLSPYGIVVFLPTTPFLNGNNLVFLHLNCICGIFLLQPASHNNAPQSSPDIVLTCSQKNSSSQ